MGTEFEHIEQDRQARLFGWTRHATKVLVLMDPEARDLLQAFADGVNLYVTSPGAQFHPNFTTYGVPVEPWTPESAILVWISFSRHFGGFGLGEAKSRHEVDTFIAQGLTEQQIVDQVAGNGLCDDTAAVVKLDDVPASTLQAMADYASTHGVRSDLSCPLGSFPPHFSQALVVNAAKISTGRALLLGEPRVPVFAPNALYEFQMKGESFDLRGATVPGSPNCFFGSTETTAWSATALLLDQADLFKIQPLPDGSGYVLDNQQLPWDVEEQETIVVSDAPDVSVTYRETFYGPVVTPIVADVFPGEEYALKAVPLAVVERSTVRGFLDIYRANSITDFKDALEGWIYPSANVVYAHNTGGIGYAAVGAIPVRANNVFLAGFMALDGNTTGNDWQEFLPNDLRPWVINPADNFLLTANHLPIESLYPLIGLIRGLGDTARSRRLRERLQTQPSFLPDEVKDTIWTACSPTPATQ